MYESKSRSKISVRVSIADKENFKKFKAVVLKDRYRNFRNYAHMLTAARIPNDFKGLRRKYFCLSDKLT